jgi:hypothetical protein
MISNASGYKRRLVRAAIAVSMLSALFTSVSAQDGYDDYDEADVDIGAPTHSETPAAPAQYAPDESAQTSIPAPSVVAQDDDASGEEVSGGGDGQPAPAATGKEDKRAAAKKAGGAKSAPTPIFAKPHFEFGLGMTTVNDDQWWTYAVLGADIPIWKFGIFLDFELFFDEDWKVSDKGWDFKDNTAEAVFRKIRYIRYGHENDPLFAKFGGLSDVTLGYGMIVDRFTNMLHYPGEKLPGLQLYVNDVSQIGLTVQTLVSDFVEMKEDKGDGGLYAVRLAVRPLKTFEDFFLDGLSVGWMYAEDRNVYAPARKRKADTAFINMRDSARSFALHGFDLSVPVIQTDLLNVDLYTQSAFRTDDVSGWGIGVPGVAVRVWTLTGNVEYRWIRGRFMPEYFDTYYLDERYSPNTGRSKDASLDDLSLSGIFGRVRMDVFGFLNLSGKYQHMAGKDKGDDEDAKRQSYEATLGLGDAIMSHVPLFDLAEIYIRNANIGTYGKYYENGNPVYDKDREPKKAGPFDRTPGMYWGYRAGIETGKGAMLIWDYRYGWKSDNNGKLVSDNQMSLQTAMRF